MELIDLYSVLPTPEEICLCDSLSPSNIPRNFHKLSVPFTDGDMKELGQDVLNPLKLVKEIPKTCKG